MFSKIFVLILLISISIQLVIGLQLENVIGGELADLKNFPWVVAVLGDGIPLCGGSLISPSKVLTAGHCIYGKQTEPIIMDYTVISGSTNLMEDDGIESKVKKIYLKKNFYISQDLGTVNDIAILKLNKKIYTSYLGLPEIGESFEDQLAVVAGYGCSRYEKVKNPVTNKEELVKEFQWELKQLKSKVLTNDKCRYPKNLDSMCAQSPDAFTRTCGICYGDSGSSLVYDNKAIGIASRAKCDEKTPSTYVKVTSYLTFIRNVLEGIIPPNTQVVHSIYYLFD